MVEWGLAGKRRGKVDPEASRRAGRSMSNRRKRQNEESKKTAAHRAKVEDLKKRVQSLEANILKFCEVHGSHTKGVLNRYKSSGIDTARLYVNAREFDLQQCETKSENLRNYIRNCEQQGTDRGRNPSEEGSIKEFDRKAEELRNVIPFLHELIDKLERLNKLIAQLN